MSQPMPLDNFRWMTDEEISNFNPLTDVNENGMTGRFLEVDLSYPSNLHLDHSSYPLAPEHMTIEEDDLSPYSVLCLDAITGRTKGTHLHKAKKLASSFKTRKNYLCHEQCLQFYVQQGLKVLKIHRGIIFDQKQFMQPYISHCAQKRAAAKTKSEAAMYKSLANSLYGKMIEDGSKRISAVFCTNKKSALNAQSNPRFKQATICDENLSIAFLKKKKLKLDQNWAVGFSILELSKLHMAKMWYQVIKPSFKAVNLILSDTDSFLFMAHGAKSPHSMVKTMLPFFDVSNYKPTHALFSQARKNQVGLLKNEVPKDSIRKVAAIKAKTYAYETKRKKVSKRSKGVKKAYRRRILFNHYAKVLKKMCSISLTQYSFLSRKHQIKMVKSERIAFSSFDDKRYYTCPIHSIPYGSKLIKATKKAGKCLFCKNSLFLI